MLFVGEEEGEAALAPHLDPGEGVVVWAYGISGSKWLLAAAIILGLFLATLVNLILFGTGGVSYVTFWLLFIAWIALSTRWLQKHFVVALTDRRIHLLRLSPPVWKVSLRNQLEHWTLPLKPAPLTDFRPGRLESKLRLLPIPGPALIRFGLKAGRKDNGDAVRRLAELLRA